MQDYINKIRKKCRISHTTFHPGGEITELTAHLAILTAQEINLTRAVRTQRKADFFLDSWLSAAIIRLALEHFEHGSWSLNEIFPCVPASKDNKRVITHEEAELIIGLELQFLCTYQAPLNPERDMITHYLLYASRYKGYGRVERYR